MKITSQYNWSRRDFRYDAKCEHCQHETINSSGYDDDNYYNNVVPGIKCQNCGESSISKPQTDGESNTNVIPKYPSHLVI